MVLACLDVIHNLLVDDAGSVEIHCIGMNFKERKLDLERWGKMYYVVSKIVCLLGFASHKLNGENKRETTNQRWTAPKKGHLHYQMLLDLLLLYNSLFLL